jgi:hypothetical protein
MIRRLVLLGCLAVALVSNWSTASYAAAVAPPCFPNDARAGCKGNTGPAGPAGPTGSAGGFDTGKLYTKRCFDAELCECDPGDFALSGGGACKWEERAVLLYSSCKNFAPEPCTGWASTCYSPTSNAFPVPYSTSVVCTRP